MCSKMFNASNMKPPGVVKINLRMPTADWGVHLEIHFAGALESFALAIYRLCTNREAHGLVLDQVTSSRPNAVANHRWEEQKQYG